MKVIVPVELKEQASYFIAQQELTTVVTSLHADGHLQVELSTAPFPGAHEAFVFQLIDYLSERSNDPVQLILQK